MIDFRYHFVTVIGMFLMLTVGLVLGMSLGAAYHYFPSKEAIVMAYYASLQDQHAQLVDDAVRAHPATRERLSIAGGIDRLAETPDRPARLSDQNTKAQWR